MPIRGPMLPAQQCPPFEMRPMLTTDLNRLLLGYIAHYRPFMKGHAREIYSVGMQKRFARLARKNNMLLAVDPSPQAQGMKKDILGWIIFKQWDVRAIIVHYIYVRAPYREQGLARALLTAAGWRDGLPIVSSHKHRLSRPLKKRYNIILNEFILEEISEWA